MASLAPPAPRASSAAPGRTTGNPPVCSSVYCRQMAALSFVVWIKIVEIQQLQSSFSSLFSVWYKMYTFKYIFYCPITYINDRLNVKLNYSWYIISCTFSVSSTSYGAASTSSRLPTKVRLAYIYRVSQFVYFLSDAVNTICPRSLDQFYKVTYYIKLVKTYIRIYNIQYYS